METTLKIPVSLERPSIIMCRTKSEEIVAQYPTDRYQVEIDNMVSGEEANSPKDKLNRNR
jgi:hypothetical protein